MTTYTCELSPTAANTADTVLRVAYSILVAEGLEALTPTRLHHETRVARTTIYRHWPTTSHLLRDLLRRATADQARTLRSGDFTIDLTAATRDLLERLSQTSFLALTRALMAADASAPRDATHSAESNLAGEYLRAFAGPVIDVIEQGLREKILAGGPAHDHAATLLGPALTRVVFFGGYASDENPGTLVAQFLAAAGPARQTS